MGNKGGGLLKYFEFSEPSHRPETGTSDSGPLPLTLSVGVEVPLTHIELEKIDKDDYVLLNATIGWKALQSIIPDTTEVSYKIRREDLTGTIVYETIDTADVDFFRYTKSFSHAETNGCDDDNKYILTATLLTADHPAAIIGPINFTGSVIKKK